MSRKQEDPHSSWHSRSPVPSEPCGRAHFCFYPFYLCLLLRFGKENVVLSQGKTKGFQNLGKTPKVSSASVSSGDCNSHRAVVRVKHSLRDTPTECQALGEHATKRETVYNIIFLKLKFSSTPLLPLHFS